MALLSVIGANAMPKLCFETTSDSRTATTVLEASLVDSIVHKEVAGEKYIDVYVGGTRVQEFSPKMVNRVFYAPDPQAIDGKLAATIPCKGSKSETSINSFSDGESPYDNDTILTYRYDKNNKQLSIKFISVVGGCCADDWFTILEYHGDTIGLSPSQVGQAICNCICAYDIPVVLENIEARKYYLSTSVYSNGGISIDLSQNEEGVVLDIPEKISMKKSACKSPWDEEITDGAETEQTSDTLVSFMVTRNSAIITSHNQSFSCCTPIETKVTVSPSRDTIYVDSYGIAGGEECDCMCEYDITTEIRKLKPQQYTFIVDGTIFKVDLDIPQTCCTEGEAGFTGAILDGTRGLFDKSSGCMNGYYMDINEGGPVEDINEGGPVEESSRTSPKQDYPERIETADTLISYQYDPETGELTVVSYGLMLNCCTDKFSETWVQKDIITINATESGERCRCTCTFDITTKVIKVKAQKYLLFVDGYNFEIDLSQNTEGVLRRE